MSCLARIDLYIGTKHKMAIWMTAGAMATGCWLNYSNIDQHAGNDSQTRVRPVPEAIMDATINAPLLPVAQHAQRRLTARQFGIHTIASLAAAAMAVVSAPALAEASPAAGDTYVYRLSNGFNNEARGQISYRVEKIDAGRIVVAVSANTLTAEMANTEINK